MRNSPALVAGILLAFLALLFSGVLPVVRFSGEYIAITVRPEAVDVDGLYIYSNPWPFPWVQGLQIPFPVDAEHPVPATVRAWETGAGPSREIRVLWLNGAPHFSILVPAHGSRHVRVSYTQWARNRSATYLLTTTRPWGRPLEWGEYRLIPQGVEIARSNYPAQFRRLDFLPQQDWFFEWSRP